MADVGLEKNLVNSQDVELTNVGDSKTYIQLMNVEMDIDRKVTKHQLTNDTVQNVYSLFMNGMQGNIALTTPQVADWTTLATSLATKEWQVKFFDSNNQSVSISFDAEVKTFRPIDDGETDATHFFRLEADGVITVA